MEMRGTVVTHGRVNSSSMWSIVQNTSTIPEDSLAVQRTRTLFSRQEDEKMYRGKSQASVWPEKVTLLTGRRFATSASEAYIYRLWKEHKDLSNEYQTRLLSSRTIDSRHGGSGEQPQFLELLDETAMKLIERKRWSAMKEGAALRTWLSFEA